MSLAHALHCAEDCPGAVLEETILLTPAEAATAVSVSYNPVTGQYSAAYTLSPGCLIVLAGQTVRELHGKWQRFLGKKGP